MFAQIIVESVSEIFPGVDIIVTMPPKKSMCHFCIPCFEISKLSKLEINNVGKLVCEKVKQIQGVDSSAYEDGFVNITFRSNYIFERVAIKVSDEGDKFGSSGEGSGRTMLFEHTSINPNATPHIGRARNAILGNALVNLMKFEGFQVEVNYFVNDIGKQIALLYIASCEMNNPNHEDLCEAYIKINTLAKIESSVVKKAFDVLRRIELGDRVILERFKRIVNICLNKQLEVFSLLDISFDRFNYESDYMVSDQYEEIISQLESQGRLFVDSVGRKALVIQENDLPMKSPYIILTRSNGTSLYILRDVAFTLDKMTRGFNQNIILLGEDQKLYFQQVRVLLDELGFNAPKAIHYAFVRLKNGKMSTRQGKVVLVEDFIDMLFVELQKKYENRLDVFCTGLMDTAVNEAKFQMLKKSRQRLIHFDVDDAKSIKGYCFTYIKEVYNKLCDVIDKESTIMRNTINISEEDVAILLHINCFEDIISRAVRECSTQGLTKYIYTLSKHMNGLLTEYSLLARDNQFTYQKVVILRLGKQVLDNCVYVLGLSF